MKRIIRHLAAGGFASLAALAFAVGSPPVRAAVESSPDRRFVTEAAQANLAEVELGRLAAAKGTHPDVREYGQKSVDDHTRFGDRLQAIARPKGFGIPTAMSGEAENLFARLTTSEGEEFDRLYMQHMAMDYDKVIDAFKKEAETGQDADLRAFAAETLPAPSSSAWGTLRPSRSGSEPPGKRKTREPPPAPKAGSA